ncbi:MAG: hypothetical protein LBV03_01045, partial [Fusobacteriales bacterium]|nr:hypothetical protein [Fusobacteriales bacterium]
MNIEKIIEEIKKIIKNVEKAEKAYADKQDIEYRIQLIYENPNAVKDVIKWSNQMKTNLNRPRSEIQNINLIFAEYLKQKGYNEKEYREIAKEATVMTLNLMAEEGQSQTSAINIGKSILSGDTDSILNYDIDLSKYEKTIRKQGMLEGASLIFTQMNQKMKNATRKTSSYNNEAAVTEETMNDLWAVPGEVLDPTIVQAYKFLNSNLNKGKLGLERMETRESLKKLPQDMELLKTYMTDFNKLLHSEAPETEKDRYYQKIMDKFPILEPYFENSVESSDYIVKDLEKFTGVVEDALEQQYKDREFEISVSMNIDENLEIKSQNLENKQKEKEKYFKISYQIPLETFTEDKNISSLAREYYKLSNPGYQEYYSKDEVSKVKKALIEEIIKNKEVSAKYGSRLTRENSQFFDTLAEKVSNEINHYDFTKKEQDKLEKLKVSKMGELKQDYENRDPMSEYTKYVVEELYPEITDSVEKNIKVLYDENRNILKAKTKFEKNFGVSYDEMTKNDKISQSLNNYLKTGSIENYKKLESDLAKEYKLKAGKISYSLNPTAELIGVSSIISRSLDNIKESGRNMLADFSILEKQQGERYTKAVRSNVVANSNNVLDYSVIGKTSNIPVYKQQKSKAEENLEKFFQGFNNVQRGMGKTPKAPTQKTRTQTVQRKVEQPKRTVTYKEQTKWEVMSKELKKAVKDLTSKAGKMGDVILKTSDKLAKLELEKLHKFSDVMGMSESDVLLSEIGILEKQRQIALEVGNKEKVKS